MTTTTTPAPACKECGFDSGHHVDCRNTRHALQQLLEDAEVEGLRDYSGRAMYGDKCLAITGGLGEIMAAIVTACLHADVDDETKYEIERAVRGVRTDSMGRDTVVYFPDVHWFADPDAAGRECDECGYKRGHHVDCCYDE